MYEVYAFLYICCILQFFQSIYFSLALRCQSRTKTSSKFFFFLSNSRISKAKEIEWFHFYTGSVYLSKRSRKQIRGILIDWFPGKTNLNSLLRTWVLLTRISLFFRGRMKYRIYLLPWDYFIGEIGNIENNILECLA